MGLDIVAYSKLEYERDERVAEVMESMFSPQGEVIIQIFEESERPRCMDLKVGKWHRSDETDEHHFRAGAYSSYNRFRTVLSDAILGVTSETVWENEDDFENSPFYELINFSDCDGVFGPHDSEKLHNDFVTHREMFEKYLKSQFEKFDREYYITTYDNFTKGFALSSQNGILVFC